MAEYLPPLEETLEKQVIYNSFDHLGNLFSFYLTVITLKCIMTVSIIWSAMKVLEAVSLIDVRRRFIEALAVQLGRPVEADPVCYLGMYFFFFPGV